MEKEVKQVSFNLNREVDSEAYKYVKTMPDFSGLTKELIVDYFSKNDFPNERLALLKNKRKLASMSYSHVQRLTIEKDIESIEIQIGVPFYYRTSTQKRLDDLKSRLLNTELGRQQIYRIKTEIKQIEGTLNED